MARGDIESDADTLRPHLFQEIRQETRESIQGMRRVAVAVHHVGRHGMVGSENEIVGVDVIHDAGPRLPLKRAGVHIGQRCMRSCSGLERGKCAIRYSIWSASTRRPFKNMYSA